MFGGCVGTSEGASVAPTSAGPVAPSTVEISASTGGVQGSVVDVTILPIPDANVTLEPASSRGEVLAATVSAVDGSFVFSLLEPGAYRVTAIRADYGAGSSLVHVSAGEVAKASVILSELPTTEPYFLLYIKAGFLPCAYSYVAYADSCNFGSAFGQSKNSHRFNVSAGHQYITVETNWPRSTVTMDHDFFARNDTKENQTWTLVGRGFGTPVLRVDFWPEKEYQATPIAPKNVFMPSNMSITFRADTYYDGQYQKEFNGALGPACAYMLLGYCTGIGVELDYRFDQYVTVFMNGVPRNILEYSAVPDQ